MKIDLFRIVKLAIKHACRILFLNFWREKNFNYFLVILLVLNISARSLQACKESHVKVANFQMCIILSCARGNIDVFSPVMCLVGILYER